MRQHVHGPTALYTVREASFLAGIRQKWIYQEFEDGVLEQASSSRTRALAKPDVIYLASMGPMVKQCNRDLKREIRAGVCRALQSGEGNYRLYHFVLDVGHIARTIADRGRQLDDVRHRLIETVPGVLGGEPVLRGTRIPARQIAELASQGVSSDELCAEFELTQELIEAAVLYMTVYPPRGRPRKSRVEDR